MRQKYFCDILSISKKCGRRRFSAKVSSTWVFRRKIKLIQEIPTTYSDYTCHLNAIFSWIAKSSKMSMQFCAICSVALNPGLKRISTAFIIRDINSCRKGHIYNSKGRIKSRESDHFSIQFAFKFRHNLRHSKLRR